MFCPNCGKTVEEANYCKYCGAKLEADSVQEGMETESFEQQKTRLMKNRIPHCPRCLSTHLTALPTSSSSWFYRTRFICMWCGYEWDPKGQKNKNY